MEVFLISYNLYKFIDGFYSAPLAMSTTNNVTTPNLEHKTWLCQEKLILELLLAPYSISQTSHFLIKDLK